MNKDLILANIEMAGENRELEEIAEEIIKNKTLEHDEKVTKAFFEKFKFVITKSFNGAALIGNKILADGNFYEFAEENEYQEINDAIRSQTALYISLNDPETLDADEDLNDLLNEIDDDWQLTTLLGMKVNGEED